MNKIFNFIVSMKTMGVLTLIFAISIAIATFVENDYGTQTAKALVYNAKWFEILLALLMLNLIGNIYRYKLYKKDKLHIFTFHIAFIVILIGSAVTRYIGYEGVMSIDENQTVNTMLSDGTYLAYKVSDGKNVYSMEKKVLLSELVNNNFDDKLEFGNNKISIKYNKFVSNAIEKVVEDKDGMPIIEMVISDGVSKERVILNSFGTKQIGEHIISFGNVHFDDILIRAVDGVLSIKANEDISIMSMDSGESTNVEKSNFTTFETRKLYQIGGHISVVLQKYYPTAKIELAKVVKNSQLAGVDAVVLDITNNKTTKQVTLFGRKGVVGEEQYINVDGVNVSLSYGAKYLTLPFSIKLDDFVLDRYPGSMSPSSYESHVTLIDGDMQKPYKIYMNNILEHQGFRFYQSSYKPDESGTILSVNHDYYGTLITYIGYTLMIIGFIWSFLAKSGRFAELSNKVAQSLVIAFLVFGTTSLKANTDTNTTKEMSVDEVQKELHKISPQHAQNFGKLLVQSRDGRVKPIDTLAKEVIRKISRKESFYGLTSSQMFLGMLSRPELWQNIKMIKVSHPQLQEELKLTNGYASMTDLIIPYFGKTKYVLAEKLEEINRKTPVQRSKYDKEVLAVDERFNIAYMVFSGSMLRIFPKPHDATNTWYDPMSVFQVFEDKDQLFISNVFFKGYFTAFDSAMQSGDFSEANKFLEYIATFQQKAGGDIIPPQEKIDLELLYNQYNIFSNLVYFFGIIGFVLLSVLIANIIQPKWNVQKLVSIGIFLISLGFLFQTLGLATRWYISGHAPWSDSYESLLYISWSIVLAGFIFAKKSQITLASTALLASITLFVAHLSWLEPEITNLVPVLKSYWLVIHVAVITASYGFLALGALLGFINLSLMIAKKDGNYLRIDNTIKELSHINEMSLLIGLALLTIGNFLGGVWANESWGRYWGWDPKETWALVTILVYTFVVHMRFIPALRGAYSFNVASVVAVSAVIMTYFGVNFYLSGLHSYAKGDPVPVPTFVYITVVVVFVVSVLAYIKNKKQYQS